MDDYDPNEAKVSGLVNRHGAVRLGLILALVDLDKPAVLELLDRMVDTGAIRDIGEHWFAAPVPPIPPASRRPVDRALPATPFERHIEHDVGLLLWDAHEDGIDIGRVAHCLDISAHAVRCSLRCLEGDGFVVQADPDRYRFSPVGLRHFARGELF